MTFPALARLQAGDVVIFEGEACEVVRVNDCAAYLRRRRVREVTVTDTKTGEARTFTAHEGGTIAISPCAFVERIRGEQ